MGSKSVLLRAVGKAVERKKLTAYHGTPHEVDKFSSDNIGTGEGAQAYGHGLYFAENPRVAEQYQDKLTDFKAWIDGKEVGYTGNPNSPKDIAIGSVANKGYDGALAHTQKMIDDGVSPEYVSQIRKEVESLKDVEVKTEQGNLYKVELDIDPDTEMLDWDAPIEKQSEAVKNLYNQSEEAFNKQQELRSLVREAKTEKLRSGSIPDDMQNKIDELQDYGDTTFFLAFKNSGNSGQDAYRFFETEMGGKHKATKKLNELGIKGIRYDDGFSRGKKGGTKNFVVFDDSLISIAEKNGIPMNKVDELAEANGIPKQQALAMLIGGSTGIGLMGGSERAEANPLTKGLASVGRLKEAAKKANLDPNQITTNADGSISYPEEYINPLSESGAGDIRREVAIHNDAVEGGDFKGEFGDDLYHGTVEDFNEFDSNTTGDNYNDSGDIGHFLTKKKGLANYYAENHSSGEGGRVIQASSNLKNPLVIKTDSEFDSPAEFFDRRSATIARDAELEGYDGIIIKGTKNDDLTVPFYPENIRSKNAAFDPQFRDSSNLLGQTKLKPLAGVAAASAGAAAAPLVANSIDNSIQNIDDKFNGSLTQDVRQRSYDRQQRIKDKFIEKRNSLGRNLKAAGELGLIAGQGYGQDITAGLAGMGTLFGHNLADGLEKHFGKDYADVIRPKKTPSQVVEGLKSAGISISDSQMEKAMDRSPELVNQLYALDELMTKGAEIGRETLDYYPATRGMKPGENFNQSVDDLSKITPAGASILKGLPEII